MIFFGNHTELYWTIELKLNIKFDFSAAKEVKRTAKATSTKKSAAPAQKATTKAPKAPKAAKPQKAAPRVGGKR